MSDPQLYRGKDEIEHWRERDPIELFAKKLAARRLLTKAQRAGVAQRVEEELQLAVDEAEAGPWEPVGDLTADVTSR